jgi:hypothetical protein
MDDRGQASLELIGALPLLAAVAIACFHLLAAGHASALADGAAEAAAIALASGGRAERAAREAVPGWASDRLDVAVAGGRVTVRLRAPTPIAALSGALEMSSTAWVRRPGTPR